MKEAPKYYSADKTEEDGSSPTYGREEKCLQGFGMKT
jgi:hypothetical protein